MGKDWNSYFTMKNKYVGKTKILYSVLKLINFEGNSDTNLPRQQILLGFSFSTHKENKISILSILPLELSIFQTNSRKIQLVKTKFPFKYFIGYKHTL